MKITLKKNNIWKYLFVYLIFQPTFQYNITNEFIAKVLNYTDEIIGVIMIIMVLFKAMKAEITLLKFERFMLIFMFIFEIFGIISAFVYKYQDIGYSFVDAYTCAKFFIYYICARLLTQGKLTDKYFFSINGICKFIAVIFFVFALHDAFMSPWWPVGDYRVFTHSVALFFYIPDALARASITVIFVLAYNYRYYKRNIYYIMMLTVVMILTFRTKAIVAVFVLYIFYIYFIKFKFKSLIPIGVATVAGASYFGYDSLNFYYVEVEGSARNILTRDSITLAKNFFPLGTGFGSYGSRMASQNYSKLYINLGYYKYAAQGMSEENGIYLSDTFWPIVIAQTGWIGTVSFVMALLSMITYIIRSRKTDVYYFWVAISIVINDLIASFASSAFFSPSSMAPFLLLGLITSIHEFPKKSQKLT
ncbi:hypothetical protein [Eubacterium sp.]